MKLVTFEVQTVLGRISRLGCVADDSVIDLNAAYAFLLGEEGEAQPQRLADVIVPPNMRAFIEMGNRALDAARQTEKAFSQPARQSQKGTRGETLVFKLSDVTLKTPLPNPNMLRDFLAFEVHTKAGFARRKEEIPEAWFDMPVYYKGNPNTLIGTDETILWPHYTKIMDYELELACIIGKPGKNIPADKAAEHIFGYAIFNDFSARDIQKGEMQCRLGPAKGKDFGGAIGPYIVTADEVGDAKNLKMTAKVNGELWSEGNSGTAHWSFEQMIAHVSMEETLHPGDILGSGTVGNGCGLELNRWIQPGDTVELEIEKLGVLKNTVGQPASI